MELRDYVRILHKSWVLILASTLLGIGVAALYSIVVTPKYEAATELYVSVRSGDSAASGDLVQGTNFARQAVTSYVDVVDSAVVLDRVIAELELDQTSAELAEKIEASSPLNTVLISITVADSDPEQAAAIANSVGTNFADVVVNNLEKPEGEALSLVKIETIQPATVPAAASSPNVPLYLILGALVGLAIGIGIAVLRSVLDTRIHSLHDIAQVTDAPLLGGIALDPGASKRPLIVHADPRNPRAESFRSLRTNLQFVEYRRRTAQLRRVERRPRRGQVDDDRQPRDLARRDGRERRLIDGDLRLPKVAEYLSIEGGVGLTDVLIGRAELVDVLQKWGRGRLYVLPPAGSHRTRASCSVLRRWRRSSTRSPRSSTTC